MSWEKTPYHEDLPTPSINPEEIERLCRENRNFALSRANKAVGLKPMMDREEAEGDALYGLVRAASRFDPSRGIGFLTYARQVIDGSILDGHYGRSCATYPRDENGGRQRVYQEEPLPLEAWSGVTVDKYREDLIDLRDGLRELPTNEAAALLMIAAGYVREEIAEADNVHPITITRRLSRGRYFLRIGEPENPSPDELPLAS